MGGRGSRQSVALLMLVLFTISTQSYYFTENSYTINELQDKKFNTLGQEEKIAIGSFPNGAVEKVKITVPDGQVVQSMNIDLESADLATSTAYSLTDSAQFSSSTSYEGVNVNTSSLSLLPQEWSWDFESGSFGPEWTFSGISNWNIQTNNAISGRQTPQAGPITSNQETGITLDVSTIPAGDGTFDYQVSSDCLLYTSPSPRDCT